MHVRLKPHPGHTERMLDPGLIIDHEPLRQNMDDLLVRRDRHRPGCIHHSINIFMPDLAMLNRDQPVTVEPLYMAARNTYID